MPGDSERALTLGRDALARHDWDEAYRVLSDANRAGTLNGEGLELFASAAFWSAHPDETVDALERAYGAHLDEGNHASAAMAAFRVAEQYGMRMAMPQAQGWGQKAFRLAQEDPTWPVNGWLTWMQGLLAWFQPDLEAAIGFYDRALEFAVRTGDRNLAAMSLHDKGHALCLLGRIDEGLPLLDEAMASVVGGELDPEQAGYVYCGMIGVCSRLGEYGRAAEWTEATLRWCERESVPAFPGVCRVHKAELMRLGGSYEAAEREALAACEELPLFSFVSGLGPANYEIGEVRRHLGDFEAAEAAYARAHQYGHEPEPGLSLLRLSQGKTGAAATGIAQALDQNPEDHCRRVRLLGAQVSIALASGELETATSALSELDSMVGAFRAESVYAMAAQARGAVALARGDAAAALRELRDAQQRWQRVQAPAETAEVRLLIAEAQRALGNDDAAAMEVRAARETFERIGARPAAARATSILDELQPAPQQAERVGRAFMFTDIVKSTDLAGVIGDEAWEDLLTWHDRTLRSLFASHGGDVGHHTGDGFFVAFADADSAIRCAIAAQRALREHRRTHGFALQIRIGVHVGDATRRGEDYGGVEVHKAARIAALGVGGEIVVSAETAAAADGVDVTDPQEVTLKGIPEPVRVGRIDWERST